MNDNILIAARADLVAGEEALRHEKYAYAIKYFRKGISGLGKLYRRPQDLDDSGMRIVLAESEESKNRLNYAANALNKVLETRIAMYEDNLADNCKK